MQIPDSVEQDLTIGMTFPAFVEQNLINGMIFQLRESGIPRKQKSPRSLVGFLLHLVPKGGLEPPRF
jgi:hypothetical protein